MSPRPADSPSDARRNSAAPARIELLTALAPGGVAVLRLSGPECLRLVQQVCCGRRADSEKPPRFECGRLTVCRLCDGNETLDEAVVALADEGGGRLSAEICLHGGVRVVQRALMLFARLGAVRAAAESASDPLADAARATSTTENCRAMTEAIEREIDALWPLATTRRFGAWLLMQRRILPEFIRGIGAAANQGATAESPPGAFDRRSTAAQRLLRGLRVAIVGPPNAGKSTLANALIGRERIVTSDVPGTTRDWVEEPAVLDGWPVTLTDTAGVRSTEDPLEALAIERGIERTRTADLVLVVFDVRDQSDDAARAVEAYTGGRVASRSAAGSEMVMPRILVVLNKIDLTPASIQRAGGASPRGIAVSALTGAGLPELERAMAAALGLDLLERGPAAMTPALTRLHSSKNVLHDHPARDAAGDA